MQDVRRKQTPMSLVSAADAEDSQPKNQKNNRTKVPFALRQMGLILRLIRPVGLGRLVECSFELPGEIAGVVVADHGGDLLDLQIGVP